MDCIEKIISRGRSHDSITRYLKFLTILVTKMNYFRELQLFITLTVDFSTTEYFMFSSGYNEGMKTSVMPS